MGRQYGTRSVSSEEAHAIVEAERKADEARRLKIERGIGLAALALGVLLLATGIFTKVTGPSRIADLQADIAAEMETLAEKQVFNESGGNINYVDPVVNSAREAGLAICELQNSLIAMDDAYQIRRRSAPPGTSVDFTDEQKSTLAAYQSWVSDGAAYGIWSYYGQWEFYDTFDYTGDELVIIWMCYDVTDISKSTPLAFVIAKYSAYADKISSLERYVTPAYSEKVSQDALRNESNFNGQVVLTPESTVLPYDQASDPSTGAPNGMSREEAEKWADAMFNNTGSQSSDGESDGMAQDTGSDVEQWVRP